MVKFYFKILIILTLLGSRVLHAQTWPAGAHDPSTIIKDGSTYWVFATGDGIVSKYSTDMVTWTDGASPFAKGVFPSWILNYAKTSTDAFSGFFWAPDIIFMNNQYYLYYSCSVWGTMYSCIGCVVNKTLNPRSPDYKWVDQGDLGLFSPDFNTGGNGWDVNAIDPSLMRGPDKKIWMIYGSFNKGGIMITEVDSVSGKPKGTRTSIANSWTGSNYGEGEGACMFYRNGYYYLVYNKGGCCNGIASSYYMVIGRSSNPRGSFSDKTFKPLKVIGAASGGSVLFKHDANAGLDDRYYGPGHLGVYRENGIDYVSFHYYNPNGYYPSAQANYKGGPTLGLGFLKWGTDGWPYVSFDFMDAGVYSLSNVNSSKALDVQNHNATNSAYLWQYSADATNPTQKWLFKPLGTGEYTIQSYADNSMYLEASGTDNNETLRLNSTFSNTNNQKFRVVKGMNNKFLVYPSTKDNVIEIPNAYTFDAQVKLKANTNHPCQRWYVEPFAELLSVNLDTLEIDGTDNTFSNIIVSGNALWDVQFADNTWLETSTASGEGEVTLSIHATENTTGLLRTNKVYLRSHSGKTDSVLITQKPKGLNITDQTGLDKIGIYPNPVSDKLYFNINKPANVSIYNSLGIKVKTIEINETDKQLNVSGLSNGIYLLEIQTVDIRIVKKLIKK